MQTGIIVRIAEVIKSFNKNLSQQNSVVEDFYFFNKKIYHLIWILFVI